MLPRIRRYLGWPQVSARTLHQQVTVFGALKVTTGAWVYRLGRRCAADFIALPDQVPQASPQAPAITVACDNDSIHDAARSPATWRSTPAWVVLYGARYSPHVNPVERVWAALKNYVVSSRSMYWSISVLIRVVILRSGGSGLSW